MREAHKRSTGKEQVQMELQHNKQQARELSSQLVTIMTTEQYTLQTGRAMTVSEANGRCIGYLAHPFEEWIVCRCNSERSDLFTPEETQFK